MKNFLLIVLIACLALPAIAQEETLFGPGARVGGFGGPIFEFGSVADDFSTLSGGGGGVVINDFFIGAFGMGGSFGDIVLPRSRYEASLGYGGVWLGYSPLSSKVIHPFIGARIGWGGLDFNLRSGDINLEVDEEDGVFVATPELGVELNVFRWFRLGGTVGYRFVNGVDVNVGQLSNSDLRGVFGGLMLRFGGFAAAPRNDFD